SPPPPLPAVDIHLYLTSDLLRLLALLLSQIAATNDSLPPLPLPSSSQLSHTRHPALPSPRPPPPSPSTRAMCLQYLSRRISSASSRTAQRRTRSLALVVYCGRMSKLNGDAVGRSFVIDSFNIHRLVIAGVTVANKTFSDVFYTNSRCAKVGGLPLGELNQLALQFLLLSDFRLVISSAEMQRYAEQLVLFSSSADPQTQQNPHPHPHPLPPTTHLHAPNYNRWTIVACHSDI
ncbi:hypothetical protein H0H87_010159, partial [Tephrocybe sp. NHM501043]